MSLGVLGPGQKVWYSSSFHLPLTGKYSDALSLMKRMTEKCHVCDCARRNRIREYLVSLWHQRYYFHIFKSIFFSFFSPQIHVPCRPFCPSPETKNKCEGLRKGNEVLRGVLNKHEEEEVTPVWWDPEDGRRMNQYGSTQSQCSEWKTRNSPGKALRNARDIECFQKGRKAQEKVGKTRRSQKQRQLTTRALMVHMRCSLCPKHGRWYAGLNIPGS